MFNLSKFKALFRPDSLPPYERAIVALEGGAYDDALARFDAILAGPALPPAERAKVHNKRGIALVNLRRRDDALAAFQAALDLQPRYAPALVNVGNLCLEDGDLDDAVSHYQSAILADEQYPVAHLNLGIAFKRLGRTSESVRELKLASRLEGRVFPRRSK
ncbi:MAG TPA: tetratricopeptide repeat protein [Candidatus Baltobacteraceae bacterium]